MSTTIEFFSAQPTPFLSQFQRWWNATTEEEGRAFEEFYAQHPHADFSFHLHWPEDIDALCYAMVEEGLDIPISHTCLLIQEIWSDDSSTWLDIITQKLPLAMANVSDDALHRIAQQWIKPFGLDQSLSEQIAQNVIKALSDLRTVSQHALRYQQSVILFRSW